jgi:hypothetical protein
MRDVISPRASWSIPVVGLAILLGCSILLSVVRFQISATCNRPSSSRDVKRVCDLEQLSEDIHRYYEKCGYYPGTGQAGAECGPFASIATYEDLRTSLIRSGIGVSSLANDPLSLVDPTRWPDYSYGADTNGAHFVVGAKMEDYENSLGNQIRQNTATGTIYGVGCVPPVYCLEE